MYWHVYTIGLLYNRLNVFHSQQLSDHIFNIFWSLYSNISCFFLFFYKIVRFWLQENPSYHLSAQTLHISSDCPTVCPALKCPCFVCVSGVPSERLRGVYGRGRVGHACPAGWTTAPLQRETEGTGQATEETWPPVSRRTHTNTHTSILLSRLSCEFQQS